MKRLPADRKEGRFKNWKGGKRESHPRENLISKNYNQTKRKKFYKIFINTLS